MVWSTSRRKERLPDDWKKIRLEVFKVKGRRCLVVDEQGQCSRTATDIDHIVAGDDHSIENLRPICSEHHRTKSSQEGWEALRKKKRIARFKAERAYGWQEAQPGHEQHEPYVHPWMK